MDNSLGGTEVERSQAAKDRGLAVHHPGSGDLGRDRAQEHPLGKQLEVLG